MAEGIKHALAIYLRNNGQSPAFQVEAGTKEDQELARHVEMMLPTLTEYFTVPPADRQDDDRQWVFRPWVEHLIEGMAQQAAEGLVRE